MSRSGHVIARGIALFLLISVFSLISACRRQPSVFYDPVPSHSARRITLPASPVMRERRLLKQHVEPDPIQVGADLILEGMVDFQSLDQWAPLIAEISHSVGGQRTVFSTATGTPLPGDGDELVCKYEILVKAPAEPGIYDVDVIAGRADGHVACAQIRVAR